MDKVVIVERDATGLMTRSIVTDETNPLLSHLTELERENRELREQRSYDTQLRLQEVQRLEAELRRVKLAAPEAVSETMKLVELAQAESDATEAESKADDADLREGWRQVEAGLFALQAAQLAVLDTVPRQSRRHRPGYLREREYERRLAEEIRRGP